MTNVKIGTEELVVIKHNNAFYFAVIRMDEHGYRGYYMLDYYYGDSSSLLILNQMFYSSIAAVTLADENDQHVYLIKQLKKELA